MRLGWNWVGLRVIMQSLTHRMLGILWQRRRIWQPVNAELYNFSDRQITRLCDCKPPCPDVPGCTAPRRPHRKMITTLGFQAVRRFEIPSMQSLKMPAPNARMSSFINSSAWNSWHKHVLSFCRMWWFVLRVISICACSPFLCVCVCQNNQ